ncbi:hypothetical protein F4803DRAFT_515710 [Xylaria telfairii]|nr:hypothetical protein F4803DRAFT_515710 [Xylaria telfairii]
MSTTALPTMATYHYLQRDPDSRVLFTNRITTMDDLYKIVVGGNSAFIALDTEHVPIENENNRILHQVGLTYLPATSTAMMLNASRKQCLSDFYNIYQLQSLTLNIELSNELQEDLIRFRGNIPNRRPSRFGYEQQIYIESLESTIIKFIQSCNNSNLVLVGFEMAAEWNYLLKNFPKAMPYFSSWIDLRDIGRDITSAKVLPGLVSMLQIFGYFWQDIKGDNRNGAAANAGDDTVSTLAIANAFFDPENQNKLRNRVAQQNRKKAGSFHENKTALLQATSTSEIEEKQRLRESKKAQSSESDFDSLGETFIGSC